MLSRRCAREAGCLLLYALADLSYEEIAFALDLPVGTVRTWLHRARRTARRVLAAETEVSLSRQEELISMLKLDRFRDFRSGVASPVENARRRAAAARSDRGQAQAWTRTMLLVRRPRTDCACPRRARHRSRHRGSSSAPPGRPRPGFLEEARAALPAPPGTILHMRWESGLGSIDPACVHTPSGRRVARGSARRGRKSARRGGRSRELLLDCTWSARGLDRPDAAAQVPHDQGLAEWIWRMRTRGCDTQRDGRRPRLGNGALLQGRTRLRSGRWAPAAAHQTP